ncbi:MAG: ABC transporter permease [Acidobacteria bacterium]|nr:ABC transporter permease [Acidobacteriota bacterium]
MYRLLLLLYPSSFRAEYGEEMCRDFARKRRQASGFFALAVLWAAAIGDAIRNGLAAHWDLLWQDVRYASRKIRRAPGFAATVVLVAALGIGATTAVFTVADYVLARPLPYLHAERLVRMWGARPGYSQLELSPPNYLDWRAAATSFEAMAAYSPWSTSMVGKGDPIQVEGANVAADLLPMLGIAPAMGRGFTAYDERSGAPGVVMLGYGLWESRFGGRMDAIGEKILLDGDPHTIIGVMPPEFSFPQRRAQLWRPLRFAPADLADRRNIYLSAIARRKPGVSLEQAREEMRVITARLATQYPKENGALSATVANLRDQVLVQSRTLVMALLGASVCVLLIACTNLANLLLARALSRQKELAVRASLGAGRERLVRQLLTESLLLAGLGGALGIAGANAFVPLLVTLVPTSLPMANPSIDGRVLLFAVAITVATGLAFGVLPALRACRDGASGLREGSRSGVGGRKEPLRSALVVAEVSLSVALLITSGLLIRALWRLHAIDPGFQQAGVLTLRTALPAPKYENVVPREAFYQRVLSGVRALPGVQSAGFTSFLPIVVRGGVWAVDVTGQHQEPSENHTASLRFITPGYFPAMGIPLKQGRGVEESDDTTAPPVAVVSESFAQRYWPGQNAIGRSFQIAFGTRTIVGVAGNVRVRGLEASSEPQVYLSSRQMRDRFIVWYAPKDLAVRSTAHPTSLTAAIRAIIHDADPQQPISDVQTLTEIVESNTASRRVQARVLGAFAAIAFLLAAVGIHGLLSFSVSQRTQEIGVRMALGAKSGQILSLILGESSRLAIAGVMLGAGLGYGAGRAMQSLLAGLDPGDSATFATAMALAVTMTLAGSLIPTARAVRVDPAVAVRAE